MVLDPDDLKVEIVNYNPLGGMSVNRFNAIRVTYLPLRLTAECGIHRSQHMNRETCIRMIEEALTGS